MKIKATKIDIIEKEVKIELGMPFFMYYKKEDGIGPLPLEGRYVADTKVIKYYLREYHRGSDIHRRETRYMMRSISR